MTSDERLESFRRKLDWLEAELNRRHAKIILDAAKHQPAQGVPEWWR